MVDTSMISKEFTSRWICNLNSIYYMFFYRVLITLICEKVFKYPLANS